MSRYSNSDKLNPLKIAVATGLLAGMATSAVAQSPYLQPDTTMITLNGTVDKIYNDAFTLDYGDDVITVEMDDGDRDADAYVLRHGDEVTVTGRIDSGFYEATTVEAGVIYVDNLDTYFYSSSLDEETYYLPLTYAPDLTMETLRGRVTAVGHDDFTLATGVGQVTIEIDEMGSNPLDDTGYPQVDENDIVSVRGHVDIDLFENHTFEAEGITTVLDIGS